jgi:hypothetical protein
MLLHTWTQHLCSSSTGCAWVRHASGISLVLALPFHLSVSHDSRRLFHVPVPHLCHHIICRYFQPDAPTGFSDGARLCIVASQRKLINAHRLYNAGPGELVAELLDLVVSKLCSHQVGVGCSVGAFCPSVVHLGCLAQLRYPCRNKHHCRLHWILNSAPRVPGGQTCPGSVIAPWALHPTLCFCQVAHPILAHQAGSALQLELHYLHTRARMSANSCRW